MGKYQYKARDKFGKLISGSSVDRSESAVADRLREANLIPVFIKKEKEGTAGFAKIFDRFKKVSLSDVNMLTRQLATLQKAGVSIVTSINALKEQATNKILKDAFAQSASDIKQGQSMSAALEKYPQIFDRLYINMIKIGEESGTLDQVLGRLASLGEHELKVRSRIKVATRYPIIVVVAMGLAFLVLTILIVPRFAKIYNASGVNLPLPTLILMWTNYAITKFWWLTLIVVGVFIFCFNKFINTQKGRYLWDNLRLKIPVFGPLMIKIAMSRFSRITGTLMRSGVPILRILELASGGVGNLILSRTIDDIKIGVKEGKGMAGPMKDSGLFPPVTIQMVSVGEETGKVDELLLYVADYYDSEVDYTIENFTSLIEPILLFVLGCGVLVMALGIFLPMWNMMALFRR